MELSDGTLRLRPFQDDDVRGIVDACRDPDTARFIPHIPVPYQEEDARRYLALTREWARDGSRIALAIADERTDELVGAIDVRVADEGTIGYWIRPEARNRGVATRALRLLSRWAVEQAGVRRLQLTTHPENQASQRVAEKAGFQRIGALERQLRFQDGTDRVLLFELDPDELREAD
jgi:RimJ/RimL family protein N-acetyltransferase